MTYLNFENFTCTLTVTRRQDGGVAVDEPVTMEIVVNGPRSRVPDPEDTGEDTRLSSQVRKLSCVMIRVLRVLRRRLERVILQHYINCTTV